MSDSIDDKKLIHHLETAEIDGVKFISVPDLLVMLSLVDGESVNKKALVGMLRRAVLET